MIYGFVILIVFLAFSLLIPEKFNIKNIFLRVITKNFVVIVISLIYFPRKADFDFESYAKYMVYPLIVISILLTIITEYNLYKKKVKALQQKDLESMVVNDL
jgi:hypothetical protein